MSNLLRNNMNEVFWTSELHQGSAQNDQKLAWEQNTLMNFTQTSKHLCFRTQSKSSLVSIILFLVSSSNNTRSYLKLTASAQLLFRIFQICIQRKMELISETPQLNITNTWITKCSGHQEALIRLYAATYKQKLSWCCASWQKYKVFREEFGSLGYIQINEVWTMKMYLLTNGSAKDHSINTFKKMNPLPSLISLAANII